VKYLSIFLLVFLTVGCASSPIHFYEGDEKGISQLSLIKPKYTEIRVEKINGIVVEKAMGSSYYLPPGKHEFLLGMLDIVASDYRDTDDPLVNSYSVLKRKICLDAEAGFEYVFRLAGSGYNWRPLVFIDGVRTNNITCG